MKLLMMSWRDIKHPLAGGAEKVTHELLKRWAAKGHTCYWFCGHHAGMKTKEKIDGITIIRRGGKLGVYWKGYLFLRQKKFDLVVDQVNTIPFFVPLYYRGKAAAFFHQLCEEIWFYEMKWPLSRLGYIAEGIYLRWYSKIPSLAVSESTRRGLIRYGIKDVHVMRNCIDTPVRPSVGRKAKKFVYVGRLKRSKRVIEIISAFRIFTQRNPGYHLDIIGRGDDEGRIREAAKGLDVRFRGYVSRERRDELVSKAKAVLVASVKEGWGLVTVEANAMGTPAIVYDVDGLRDSVVDGKTGIVLRKNTPAAMAKAMEEIGDMGKKCLSYARSFDWDETALDVMKWMEGLV